MYDSIVLLGYSGAGKDTICKALTPMFEAPVVNVKIGALVKDLFADLFRVDREMLDKAGWRNEPLVVKGKQTTISPLTLLSVLFYGGEADQESCINFKNASVLYALSSINTGSLPVFTDVRRKFELEAIRDRFSPLVVELTRPNVAPGVSDAFLPELMETAHLTLENNELPHKVAQRFMNFCKPLIAVPKPKPTLHIVHPDAAVYLGVPHWQPASLFVSKLTEALNELLEDGRDEAVRYLCRHAANGIDLANIKCLPPIVSDCMTQAHLALVPLLPRLRELANIQYHTLETNDDPLIDHLNEQELSNVLIH